MCPCKKTVFEYLYSLAEKKPNFMYLETENEAYTAKEFFNTVCYEANSLVRKGVKKGDTVAILVKKDIETIIYFFACQILGAVALMIDEHENINALENEYGIKIKYSILEDRQVTKTLLLPMLEFPDLSDSRETTIEIFTSGSTGERKIVKLSQYAFINNAVDSKIFGWYEESDVALAFLPLTHVFAMALLFTSIVFGFKVVVAKEKDIPYLLECVQKYHITRFNGVPTLFLRMVELKDGYDISSFKCAYIGGAPSSQKEYFKIEESLGIKLLPVYGMSECVGISSGGNIHDSKVLANSVGQVYSLNDVILDKDGEILVKGPSMCNGYLKGDLPLKDGYLLTGDIGEFDKDGFLHIVGRKKEIIIRNGINISIPEITKKLSNAEMFKDFVVVGIEDKCVGEIPALAVVLYKDEDKKDINIELSKYLNKFEMPAQVLCVDSIPLLENGKIDKETIKKLFIS